MKGILLKILVVILLLPSAASFCQPQLVLIKRERVLKRYYPGDDFVFRLKGSKSIRRSYINNLSDTSVVTHSDTIPFHKIEKIYYPHSRFYNTIGWVFVAAGVGYFLVDQINNDFDLNGDVVQFSTTSVAIGLPFALYSPKWQRLNRKFRLVTAKKGSGFYQPQRSGFTSPFLDN